MTCSGEELGILVVGFASALITNTKLHMTQKTNNHYSMSVSIEDIVYYWGGVCLPPSTTLKIVVSG